MLSRSVHAFMLLGGLGLACKQEPTSPPPAAPPQAARPSAPGGQPAAQEVPSGPPVTGQVTLGGGLAQSDVKADDVLFVMARKVAPGGGPGPLVAVQRLTNVQFPTQFRLSSDDVMVPGSAFTGPFTITARLDRDGDPMTRTEADLYGAIDGPVNGGQSELALSLTKGMPANLAIPAPANPHGAAPANPHGAASANPHGAAPANPHGAAPANPHGAPPR